MDIMAAFAMGQVNKGKESMVFDWDKAAEIIKERGAVAASAGLSGDWEWTGGPILADGRPVPEEDTYVYLASTWAEPELHIEDEVLECYRMADQSPGWGDSTYWPPSALAILKGASA